MNHKVCVIGAGCSGMVMIKCLKELEIDFDCFEKGSGIGGNWRYQNDNGMSSAYRSLHINTSRQMMAYSDFPMPDDYPDYPHHSQILTYFEEYVDHFDLRKHITFNTGVADVSKHNDGSYSVTTDAGQEHSYTSVIVCNGHHWDPRLPKLKGSFSGESMHSHFYKTPEKFEGKRVLVLGIGNSGVDIACEASRSAEKVFLATRSGAYILPKYMLGKPTDTLGKPPMPFLPMPIQRGILTLSLWLARGKQEGYGVPKPKRKLLREHPTVSQDLLNLVGHGKIHIKPNIRELDGSEVVFEDDSREKIDILIQATGYNISFPFFKADFLDAAETQTSLYQHVVHPDHEHLYFVGLIQPLGAIMPLAEQQAIWIARLLKGKVRLPEREHMEKAIEKEQEKIHKRYIDRPRHTIQVDFFPYKRKIEMEMKKFRVK